MRLRRLVHFLDIETREPLCGGGGTQAVPSVVNGVSICAVCARRVTDDVGRAMDQAAILAPGPSSGGAGA